MIAHETVDAPSTPRYYNSAGDCHYFRLLYKGIRAETDLQVALFLEFAGDLGGHNGVAPSKEGKRFPAHSQGSLHLLLDSPR